jgi:hypothetical protein
MPKPTLPAAEVLPNNLRHDESGSYLYDDEAALKIVLDATSNGDAWMNQQNWPAGWSTAYQIYQSPAAVSCFDGGGNSSAHVPNYTVSNLCDTTVPKIMGGLFYESPPFLLRPRPGTTQDMVDAKTALFAYQLSDMQFEEECELAVLQGALIGTMVMKWGWTERTEKTKKYKRRKEPQEIRNAVSGIVHKIHSEESDAFDIEYEEKLISRPWIKYCDRRCVIVNRGCRVGDIRKAKDVVYRDYATYEDLDQLRGYEGYTIPSEAELQNFYMRERFTPDGDNIAVTLPESMRGWIQTALPRNYKDSADPLQNGLELLEYWSNNFVIVVLRHGDDNILIRNEANPYKKIPFYSACWRPIPDCFDGQGIGVLAGSNQLVAQGITDLSLSRLDYGLQPTAIRSQGFNTPGQDLVWTQGGIIDVEGDVDKAFKFLEFPPQDAAAMAWLIQQQAEAKETVGANQQFSMGAGAPGIQTTGARSGSGAQGIMQANASRLDGPIGRIVRQIFIPWLQQMDELNNDRLPSSVLRDVLSKEMGKQFDVDHIQFRSAELEYEVLAGAKLGPKKEMAQFFPFLIQLMNNPTFVTMLNIEGFKFKAANAFKNFASFAGWKYAQDFVVPMTPQEQQKADAQLPSAINAQKAKAAKDMENQKFENAVKEEQEKQLSKAGGEVTRTTIEHAMDADTSGLAEPFGSDTQL